MKQSSTERTGDEVVLDLGCKTVSESYMRSLKNEPEHEVTH